MRDRLPAWRPTSTLAWVAVAGLLIALAARAQGIVSAVHSNADLAAPLAMSDLLAHHPDAAATTGNYGWWNGLWVVQVLQALTGGTLVASYLPLVGMVVAIAVLTWQAARLFGTRAAVAVPLVAGSIGAVTWTMDGAWSGRAPSWWGMVALGVLLVARADGWPRRARVLHGAATFLVVLWCAAALSGDALAWTSIVLPALGVAAAAVLTRRPRQAVFPSAAAVAIAVLSVVVREVAHHLGYFQRPSPTALTRFEEAQAGAGNVAVGLQAVWRGPDDSTAGAAAGYLGLVLVLAAVAAGVAALASVVGARWIRAAEGPADQQGTAASPMATASDASFAPTAWAAFWLGMVLATVVAFAFSSSSFADGQPVARYLFGVPFAAGALLALLAGRTPAPVMVVAPAGLLAVLAIVGMARETAPLTPEARTPALTVLQAAAREEGVTRGYASYWSAYPLTVGSGFRLQIDPVGECSAAAGVGLCPMYLHYVDRAYEPQRGIRSFLLVDTGPGASPGIYVTRAPDGIAPIATRQIEPGLQMLVFDHDIASDLQPRTLLGDPLRHRG
jgi:hypothetical protein